MSGFVIQYWEDNMKSCLHSTSNSISYPQESNCLWLTDYTGIGTVPVDTTNTLSCSWTISNSISDSLAIFFKDLNFGSATRDSISISSTLDSGYFESNIVSQVTEYPYLVVIPAQLSPKNIDITYSISGGGGRGFTMLLAPLNDLHYCLNTTVLTPSTNSDLKKQNIQLDTQIDKYFLIPVDSGQFITSWFDVDDWISYTYWGPNRCMFYSPSRAYSLTPFTDMPDESGEVALIRVQSFGLNLRNLLVMFNFFVPDASQISQTFTNRLITSFPSFPYSIAMVSLDMNYYQRLSFHDTLTDPYLNTTIVFPDFPFIKEKGGFEIRSIDMCMDFVYGETLIVSFVDNRVSEPIYNILTFNKENNVTFKLGKYHPVVNASFGSNYGEILSVSPSCIWAVTTHSPQLYKIFLLYSKAGRNSASNDGEDPTPDYTYWQFFRVDSNTYLKSMHFSDDFLVITTCNENYVTFFLLIFCCESDNQTCSYDIPTPSPNLNVTDYASFRYNQSSYLANCPVGWTSLSPIIIPYALCSMSTTISSQTTTTASGGRMYVAGVMETQSVYVIFDRVVLSDLTNNITFSSYDNSYNISMDQFDNLYQVCLNNPGDNLFGSDVAFSVDQNELLVLGSLVYVIKLNELFSKALPLNSSDCYNPTLFLTLSIYPDRFTFEGENWSTYSNGNPMQFSVNYESASILIDPTPVNKFQFQNSTRTITRTTIPGTRFTAEYFSDIQSIKQASIDPMHYDLFDYEFNPCPRGSFNSESGFSTCFLCSAGSYQNSTGSRYCYPCSNNSYCPLGAIIEMNISNSSDNITLPNFNTYSAIGVDTLVWSAVFQTDASFAVPLYLLWSLLFLGGLYIYIVKKIDEDNATLLGKARVLLKNFYLFMDTDATEYWDPVAKKFREKASLISSLLNLALIVFLIIATVYIIIYFYQYTQYVGQDNIMNNVRTSTLKPYFTATQDETGLLNYLKSLGMILTVSISGYSYADCQELCNGNNVVQSVGCNVYNSYTACSDASKQNCSASISNDTCIVDWYLPPRIDLQRQSSFTFILQNVYAQELLLQIRIPGNPNPQPSGVDLTDNTAVLYESETSDLLQLKNTSLLLFGITRQYELTYVLQTSEQVQYSGNNPGSDYKMQAVFTPLESSIIETTTTSASYFGTQAPNSITIEISQESFFVSNSEGRIYEAGQLFLILVNILCGIIGIFDLFQKVLEKILSFIEKIKDGLEKCYEEEEEEKEEELRHRRVTRAHFNPYDEGELRKFILRSLEDPKFASQMREVMAVNDRKAISD